MLSNSTDHQLVYNIKENNNLANDSVVELLGRHVPLYNKIVSSMVSGVMHQELMDDKYVVLYDAARKYDTNKSVKFSTWFGEMARYHTLNYLKDVKKDSVLSSIDDNSDLSPLDNITHYEVKTFENEGSEFIIGKLKKINDKRISKIFDLRFNKCMKWDDIAVKMKLSVVSCISLYNKGKSFLKNVVDIQENVC